MNLVASCAGNFLRDFSRFALKVRRVDEGQMTFRVLDFVKIATERLKDRRFRITHPKTLVTDTLARTDRPLKAHRLYTAVTSAGSRIEVVSVYRCLAALKKLPGTPHLACRRVCGLYAPPTDRSAKSARSLRRLWQGLGASSFTRREAGDQLDVRKSGDERGLRLAGGRPVKGAYDRRTRLPDTVREPRFNGH